MPITEMDPVWVERTRARLIELRTELEELSVTTDSTKVRVLLARTFEIKAELVELTTQLDEWEAEIAAGKEQDQN